MNEYFLFFEYLKNKLFSGEFFYRTRRFICLRGRMSLQPSQKKVLYWIQCPLRLGDLPLDVHGMNSINISRIVFDPFLFFRDYRIFHKWSAMFHHSWDPFLCKIFQFSFVMEVFASVAVFHVIQSLGHIRLQC